MRVLCACLALAAVAVLVPAGSPAGGTVLSPLSVGAPPLASDDAANTIFDAMIAIARAKATDPGGAERAAASYATALQRYNAGDQSGAWTNALTAIDVATERPYPVPAAWGSPSPGVSATAPMPAIVDVAQAMAEVFLGVGRRALIVCGVSDPALLQALRQRYGTAVAENLRHDYDGVLADSRTIIDACAVPPTPAPASPSPH